MSQALWQFAEVEAVYQRLRPLTPYGRLAASRRQLLSDARELNNRYDRLETLLGLLDSSPADADRIRHHLKRIPSLPQASEVSAGADLFLVKKFLVNYKALFALLSDKSRRQFGFIWKSEELLASLAAGGDKEETFYISDAYSGEIATVRASLRQLDESLGKIKSALLESLRTRLGLDFQHRDFLVIDNRRSGEFSGEALFLEPFDSRHVIVKPVLPKEYFQTLAGQDSLLARQRELEQAVIAKLAAAVKAGAGELQSYVAAVESLDAAMAGAELARALNMTRPQFAVDGKPMEIVGGRLIPLEENCVRQQLDYWPLTIRLDSPHSLLHGSNMSGKSVILKTVASLQILAQMGLFVPAKRFTSVPFENMFFIGASGAEEARGLSSFGQEMVALRAALEHRGRSSLFVIDEFARTTNSKEAAALIAGLLNFFERTEGTCSLMATHYVGLPEFRRVRYYRMKGLDWDKIRTQARERTSADLSERIRMINRCMAYEMVPDSQRRTSHDAVSIAEMLGLDESIIAFARKQVEME
jgi:DNA mismatch repair ATPase MutS